MPLAAVVQRVTVAKVAAVNCRITRRSVPSVLVAGAAALTFLGIAPVLLTAPVGADPAPSQSDINATQAQVNQLEQTIAQQQQRTAALSQQYDAAQQQLADLHVRDGGDGGGHPA